MKRWTNGLPGATKRLGAIMALCGLSGSKPRMRADTHDGPEQIAPLQRPDTLMQLSRSLILEVHLVPHGRAIHFGTQRRFAATHRLGRYWRHSGHQWTCRFGQLGRVLTRSGPKVRPKLARCFLNVITQSATW